MTEAYAISLTKSMLGHYPFTYCPTLANKTSNHTPHKGDVVLFYVSGDYEHTGLVYDVDSQYFYTIEGNTSGGSSVIANGGGVCKKMYWRGSYSSSKFYRPDYDSLVRAGHYASTSAAIQAVIDTAAGEVGYLEKKSNSSLDSKTGNAGSANYTKYWRDVLPSGQGQPWCAAFVTWCFQKAFEKIGTTATTTTVNPYAGNSVAEGMQKYKNGSTDEIVYQTSALEDAIGCLNPYEECYCFGQAGGAYLVAYKVDGTDNTWKAGYVEYYGKTTFEDDYGNDPADGMQLYKNGSTEEVVYQTSDFSTRVGCLNPYEECYCFGQAGGGYLVCYKVDGTDNTWKTGYCEYSGKTTF